jgi:hypothetical protein
MSQTHVGKERYEESVSIKQEAMVTMKKSRLLAYRATRVGEDFWLEKGSNDGACAWITMSRLNICQGQLIKWLFNL